MKNIAYVLIDKDLELNPQIMVKDEAIRERDRYNNRYPLNTPLMVIECELDEDGEPDVSNYNIVE